jgi:hypothetical protein
MPEQGPVLVLVDSATATALAQILPVLLLTLTVELRRTRLHRTLPKLRLAAFFTCFAIIETILVLSIDGALYPFQWFDLVTALLIVGLLALLFVLALIEPRDSGSDG